ncbi:enoyl-CoA hydratase-related protein [Rhodococcus sp. SGAir0479]|uniref:enoyl-CoA hydratase-related protein n=1 Tax=Rhodococcus sp. SGAir0479 TaxID=2567884 RepID=UPI0010CCDBBF|nr:enoyl-CoA hydratase-related protein [Rhodococcus sp. SGAir0479]QCQ92829.1 enoyl-CoA hydratase [Rhodococcus sp. SGAir0479]
MTVRYERRDRILVIHIEREERRNAIDRRTAEGLEEAFDLLDDDPDLWAGIVTGTPRIFSAGTDIRERADLRMPRGGEYGIIRRKRATPLIAAVEGYALGGGFEIALACDLVVAARTAEFGLPETRRGLVASSGALFRAPRALPVNVARELMITGRTLSAERAHTLGVVNEVTEDGAALAGALRMAHEICQASPVAVRESLRALDAQFAAADERGWDATADALRTVLESDDFRAGIEAFEQRSLPMWTGH